MLCSHRCRSLYVATCFDHIRKLSKE